MDTFIKHADHAQVVGDLNIIIDKQSKVIADLNSKLSASFDNIHANMVMLTDYRTRCAELVNKLQATEAQLAELARKYNDASKKRPWSAEVDKLSCALVVEKSAHSKLQGQYDNLNKKATEQAKLLAELRGLLNCRRRGSERMIEKIAEVLA